mgnify:CR=1 FL=1
MTARASGGAHTSRTMLLSDLAAVLAACPPATSRDGYRLAVADQNVAGKGSLSSRQRTFRYLCELYWLDAENPAFRAMRRLWARDPHGRPLIALLVAHANDKALSATTSGILSLTPGEAATADSLADAIEREFPRNYSPSVQAKIGRNALSSWTQAGYLARHGRGPALRQEVAPTPGTVAMALVLAYLDGLAGERLFDSPHAHLLDSSSATLHDRAHDAARKGWLEYRSRGMVTEVDLSALVAEPDDPRLLLDDGAPR